MIERQLIYLGMPSMATNASRYCSMRSIIWRLRQTLCKYSLPYNGSVSLAETSEPTSLPVAWVVPWAMPGSRTNPMLAFVPYSNKQAWQWCDLSIKEISPLNEKQVRFRSTVYLIDDEWILIGEHIEKVRPQLFFLHFSVRIEYFHPTFVLLQSNDLPLLTVLPQKLTRRHSSISVNKYRSVCCLNSLDMRVKNVFAH